MQGHTAYHLNIVMAQPERALAGFADSSKGFWQQVIQRLAFCQPLLEFACFMIQGIAAQALEDRFELVDFVDDLREMFNFALVRVTPKDTGNFL